jgi:hypothetical protein
MTISYGVLKIGIRNDDSIEPPQHELQYCRLVMRQDDDALANALGPSVTTIYPAYLRPEVLVASHATLARRGVARRPHGPPAKHYYVSMAPRVCRDRGTTEEHG